MLDQTDMTARLRYAPRGGQPLSDSMRKACVKWASAWAEREGYEVDTSEVEA
jgi:hypothetical protein